MKAAMLRKGCSITLYDGRSILLVQRAGPPYAGLWTLPGGRIEQGERPVDAICREVWEELGLIVSAPLPVMTEIVDTDAERFQLSVFVCHLPHRAPLPSLEIANWEWVEPAELVGYRTTPGLEHVVDRCVARIEDYGS